MISTYFYSLRKNMTDPDPYTHCTQIEALHTQAPVWVCACTGALALAEGQLEPMQAGRPGDNLLSSYSLLATSPTAADAADAQLTPLLTPASAQASTRSDLQAGHLSNMSTLGQSGSPLSVVQLGTESLDAELPAPVLGVSSAAAEAVADAAAMSELAAATEVAAGQAETAATLAEHASVTAAATAAAAGILQEHILASGTQVATNIILQQDNNAPSAAVYDAVPAPTVPTSTATVADEAAVMAALAAASPSLRLDRVSTADASPSAAVQSILQAVQAALAPGGEDEESDAARLNVVVPSAGQAGPSGLMQGDQPDDLTSPAAAAGTRSAAAPAARATPSGGGGIRRAHSKSKKKGGKRH